MGKAKVTYQGWANYETWCVALWIDNDQGIYNHWLERAREAIFHVADNDEKPTRDEKRRAVDHLADWLKEQFEEEMPGLDGMWADLLGAALSEVDWHEIAVSRFEWE